MITIFTINNHNTSIDFLDTTSRDEYMSKNPDSWVLSQREEQEESDINDIYAIAESYVSSAVSFGESVIRKFLVENAEIQISGTNITVEQVNSFMSSFSTVIDKLRVGAIQSALEDLREVPTSALFNQERKNSYISLFTDFLVL